ncbi:C-type lectin domain family 4 member M-like [Centroberyx affinis]|uniref:C-type lectin domain family 4 member M-like n=1 Tax=Centroberyx affinis TaxID=166261 RepID=UPI003A5BDDF5
MAPSAGPGGSDIIGEYENIPEDPAIDMILRTSKDQKRKVLYRMLAGSIGLLFILQALLNISLRLLHTSTDTQWDRNWTEQTGDNNLTEERDQLLTSYNQLIKERDMLQTSYNNVTKSRDQLQTSYHQLTEERDQLQTSYNNVTKSRDQLQTSYKQLLTICNKLTEDEDCQDKLLCSEEASCPESWLKLDCSCYYVSTEEKTWDEGRQDCLSRGADLVIIKGYREKEFLDRLNKDAWLGLTDREEEGNWTWVDGTPMRSSKSFWTINQPDNGGIGHPREEDCGHLRYVVEHVIGWNDVQCNQLRAWICEKKIAISRKFDILDTLHILR